MIVGAVCIVQSGDKRELEYQPFTLIVGHSRRTGVQGRRRAETESLAEVSVQLERNSWHMGLGTWVLLGILSHLCIYTHLLSSLSSHANTLIPQSRRYGWNDCQSNSTFPLSPCLPAAQLAPAQRTECTHTMGQYCILLRIHLPHIKNPH